MRRVRYALPLLAAALLFVAGMTAPANGAEPDAHGDVSSHCHTGSKFRGAGGEDRAKNGTSDTSCSASSTTPPTTAGTTPTAKTPATPATVAGTTGATETTPAAIGTGSIRPVAPLALAPGPETAPAGTTAPTPARLAFTGVSPWPAPIGAGLVLAGAGLLLASRRRRPPT